MSHLRRVWVPAAFLSGGLVLVYVFPPLPFGLALRVWLVGIGALAASVVVRAAVAHHAPLRIELLWFRRPARGSGERPAGLAEWERAVDFASWNPADFQRRLRPLLRGLAEQRLRARRGVDLETQPEAARALLGEETWRVLFGGRAAGIEVAVGGPAAIREAVVSLERI